MAVYDGKVWFGNQRYGTWIKAPLADMDVTASGFTSEQQFTNGGSFIRSSFGSAKAYRMSWNGDLDELQPIRDFKDGIYGGGLIYWEDPFAKNILPPHWAAPMLTVRDWPSLISSGNKPEPITEITSGKNLPYQSAKYVVTNNSETNRSLTLLIPEEHVLRLGFVYSATGTASIKVAPVLSNGTEGTHITLAQLAYNSTSIYDSSAVFSNVTGAANRTKAIRIYISRSDNSASTITIRGGIATLFLADGISGHMHDLWSTTLSNNTNWSSGQGATGCVIQNPPTIQYKNVVGSKKLISMSIEMKEIEAWL